MKKLQSPWCWLAAGLCAIYVRGLFIDLMDVDASQYATIAMELVQHGNWLQLHYRFADYLDKPPLLFWTSALSLRLFGLHVWAYKLPSMLAAGAGIYAVYRFCLLHYARATARNAAFILASCVGAVLMCNDVRTDAMLTGMTACAVWQSAEYLRFGRTRNVLLLGVFTGLALLTKGPIGLVMPTFAIGAHLLLRRDWRGMLQWRWLLALAVTAVVIAPMCWGLYQQFDLHPEKVVNGATGVSGLRFFFWDQSFGRITGSSSWKNDTTYLTFVHVYLWVFLPWTLLFGAALWRRGVELVRAGFAIAVGDEGFSIGGFALTFVALSLSHYKLPHYIFITLPWAAVLVARWLAAPSRSRPPWIAQYVLFALLAAVVVWLLRGVFPPGATVVWEVAVILFADLAWQCVRRPFPPDRDLLVQRSVLAAIATLFVVNYHFYPNLLPYQSTTLAPRIAREAGVPLERTAVFNQYSPSLDFYSGRTLPAFGTAAAVRDSAAAGAAFWLFTDSAGKARLDSASVTYSTIAEMPHFEVALLTGTFLNAKTRSLALHPTYLLKISTPGHSP
jgi:4-amino-4-deoxy-L-arabinose transferase-like glycosyltransferase